MGNVIVDQDVAGNIKPNKKKSTEKIDGVVALIMGLARATLGGGVDASVYEGEGFCLFRQVSNKLFRFLLKTY